ncbi:Protein of unknown function, partial [Gryllus bimaculatus]
TNSAEWFTTASVHGTFAVNIHDPLFGQTEVTPTIAMSVIDSSAVEHAATASAADAYTSLVKGQYLL